MIDSQRDCRLLYDSATVSHSTIHVLRARLAAVARRLSLSELVAERMALVASELISNQVKYAGSRGVLQLWQQPGPVLDIFALDYGPGIDNFDQAASDGYSTGNTLGKGLGSIHRLSDDVHFYSIPSAKAETWHGTAILARFHSLNTAPAFSQRGGLYCRAFGEDRYIGDRVLIDCDDRQAWRWLHLDGLGHGQGAERSTALALNAFSTGAQGEDLLTRVDAKLRAGGGAVAVAGRMDFSREIIELAGVGDVHARVWDEGAIRSIGFPSGLLGGQMPTLQTTPFFFGPRAGVLTASDGIRRSWKDGSFPGLFSRSPQLIAYILGNIMGRVSDDQSVFTASAIEWRRKGLT